MVARSEEGHTIRAVVAVHSFARVSVILVDIQFALCKLEVLAGYDLIEAVSTATQDLAGIAVTVTMVSICADTQRLPF